MTPRPSEPTIAQRLRHPQAEVREAARQAVAAALQVHGGDARAAAAALGVSAATVRKWGARPAAAARRAADAPPPLGYGEAPPPSPFEDFRPEHRLPLPITPPAAPGDGDLRSSTPAAASAGTGTAPPGPGPRGAAVEAGLPPRPHAPVSGGQLFTPAPGEPGDDAPRRVAFVLHAHLPWVLGHGSWPHGEEWLAEAVAHCYLPLITMLQRLGEEGRRRLLAFSVTPVLAAQLADARTPPLVDGYLDRRLEAAEAQRQEHPLASWWHGELVRARHAWRAIDRDPVGALAALERAGVVELSTAAASHPYLPLLHRVEHARLQIVAARQQHQVLFGRPPRGLWMPECAYRAAGPWHHPRTGAYERHRPGNEELLEEAGIRWTVVDAHLVLGSEPLTGYGLPWGATAGAAGEALEVAGALARRLQPAWIDGSRVAAMVREPHTARQVWSREVGYPGDARYLDFHKRHSESGLRLWRVTDARADLADKLPYWPADAHEAVRAHARHFIDLVGEIPGLGGGVAVCPFDAELFGHWWYEGPLWLEEVLRGCAPGSPVRTITPEAELAERSPRRRCELAEGSWGEGGGHDVWLHPAVDTMWRQLREAEEQVAVVLAAADRPAELLRAILAQLLLLAASDWPFLVSRETAADYAAGRFAEHRRRLQTLLELEPSAALPAWVGEDLPAMELDPRWWSLPSSAARAHRESRARRG